MTRNDMVINLDRPEKRAPPPVVQALFVSLHAELPGEQIAQLGHELCYPGYRRKRVDRRADGQWPEQITLDFARDTSSANVVARFFGLSHSETGDLLYSDLICPRIPIVIGITPILTLYLRSIAMLGAYRGTIEVA